MSELNELLERFRRGPEMLAMATTGASNPELDFIPGPGEWSVRQIACHLADAEVVGTDRMRRTIAEESPTVVWFDEQAWAAHLDYNRRKISNVLETFRLLRHDNHDLLQSLPEAAFSRTCVHSKNGPMTLLDLLRDYAGHAESHVRQIMDTRQKYKASRVLIK
ncbi:MAG: DinB family protein [Acidobacteriia bacterium]|nr:DinB family protein [Terriglobia bacterium]